MLASVKRWLSIGKDCTEQKMPAASAVVSAVNHLAAIFMPTNMIWTAGKERVAKIC